MEGALRIGGVAGLAAIVIASLTLTPAARSQRPMQLLTDTPHYCAELFTEVQETRQALVAPPPRAVVRLAIEGRQLCLLGEVEGGVTRLRRAMVILHKVSGRH